MIRSPPWPVNIIVETGLPLPATVDACIHLYSIILWNKYGGPEGPCPLPISIFPITNFQF